MKIEAFIQMGAERRETVIEISKEEVENGRAWCKEEPGRSFEGWLERYVIDWLHAQYGWGWSGGGYTNDFACMEGEASGGYGALAVTSESSIPNTERVFCGLPQDPHPRVR